MSDLSSLEPKILWSYFLELSRIPRGSHHEAAAARWAIEHAKARGLDVEVDRVGNVLIRKPSVRGRESRGTLALQAHLDMVCEKNEGTQHDFLRDPIRVMLDGDLVHAQGTTLGADNGIGVAAAMAALTDPQLEHPALEVLLTVDEETGLMGAVELQPGWLRATRLLNLDSEDERELTIGCAGGIDTVATRAITFVPVPPGTQALRLKVHGLRGGHSGIDIAANRGNALRILGHVLARLGQEFPLLLGTVQGGNKRNAIAREAWATLHVSPEHEASLTASVESLALDWRAALGSFEPNLTVTLEPLVPMGHQLAVESRVLGEGASLEPQVPGHQPAMDPQMSERQPALRALSAEDATAVIDLLLTAPHGVEAFSPQLAHLVQTSTNLGVVETTDTSLTISFLTRSTLESSKVALVDRIAVVARLAGFRVESSSGYPGWDPVPTAELVKLVNGAHRELFGEPMKISAIHAGLECGIIGRKYPDLEMASIGPSMWDVHTPDERVSVASVQRFWRLLTGILERA